MNKRFSALVDKAQELTGYLKKKKKSFENNS
jgi:hypothetical protein